VAEPSPSKQKALSSNPSTTKERRNKKKKLSMQNFISSKKYPLGMDEINKIILT
jgi:hypothetical protein